MNPSFQADEQTTWTASGSSGRGPVWNEGEGQGKMARRPSREEGKLVKELLVFANQIAAGMVRSL